MDELFGGRLDSWLCVPLLYLLLLLQDQNVWLVSDSFLFRLHGTLQPGVRSHVRHIWLPRDLCLCKENILYSQNRLKLE